MGSWNSDDPSASADRDLLDEISKILDSDSHVQVAAAPAKIGLPALSNQCTHDEALSAGTPVTPQMPPLNFEHLFFIHQFRNRALSRTVPSESILCNDLKAKIEHANSLCLPDNNLLTTTVTPEPVSSKTHSEDALSGHQLQDIHLIRDRTKVYGFEDFIQKPNNCRTNINTTMCVKTAAAATQRSNSSKAGLGKAGMLSHQQETVEAHADQLDVHQD